MKERYHPLTGHYIDDELLHLGVVDGRETRYACGAKPLATVSTFAKDDNGRLSLESLATFRTEPTQHRRWTTDRKAFAVAVNRCQECEERVRPDYGCGDPGDYQ